MVFIVETGAGTPNANSYVTLDFITAYLTDRGRETENNWLASSVAEKQESAVEATDFIDFRHGHRVKGERLRQLIAGRKSSGTITFGALPLVNEVVTVGQLAYRFVDVLSQENDVLRGSTTTESATNLALAVNSGGPAAAVQADTQLNYEAEATAATATVTVEAQVEGASGDAVVFTTTVTGATISGSGTLAGGIDEGPQPRIFPRRGMLGFDGRVITGIPLGLKQATAEYSVRAMAAILAPDLTVDDTGALVQRKMEKVGPLEEETEYAEGATPRIFRPYPAADGLLREYLKSAGGVVR